MVHAPFYARYVALSKGASVTALRALVGDVDTLRAVDDDASLYSYAPTKWTLRELVQHLIDCERIMADRALRIARGDTTPLPGFDEDAYVLASNANERPWSNLLDELLAVRTSTVALFDSFGHPDNPTWLRQGIANGAPVDVQGLAAIIAGHAAHHMIVLHDRYSAALPPRP